MRGGVQITDYRVQITEYRVQITDYIEQITENKYNYRYKMFGIGLQEIIVIALVVLLLFGGKKIPELMKGLGKGVRSFKDGMNGKEDKGEGGEQ